MSGAHITRALARLEARGAVLQETGSKGGCGVFQGGDRRRRPIAKLSAADVGALVAEGAIAARVDGAFELTEAGRARVRRDAAAEGEAFIEQHRRVVARSAMSADGHVRAVRGHAPNPVIVRLSHMRDARGRPWLSEAEVRAASKLCADWERSQVGLVRGSDWSAPPLGGAVRGPGSAQENAMAARCDAGRRMAKALDALAPPLRRTVMRVCVEEQGLEALECTEGWPARSGRLALKLGLAQLAALVA